MAVNRFFIACAKVKYDERRKAAIPPHITQVFLHDHTLQAHDYHHTLPLYTLAILCCLLLQENLPDI